MAAGPLIGGLFTTYLSWRWVFVSEVLVVLVILTLNRRTADVPAATGVRLDLVGTALSGVGMALIVFGVLRAGAWGIVRPKTDAPQLFGVSIVLWLELAGGLVLWLFFTWEERRIARGRAALVDPAILRYPVLRAGLTSFFFQYVVIAGLFFTIPLYLSVALGLSAVATGVRLLPLSATLLLGAVGIPRLLPNASPRRVVRLGFVALFAAIVVLLALLSVGSGPEVVTWPMLLAGLGLGALASQLGAITVSSVPDERSGEVGGLQNTLTNLGSSIGTAVSGAVLISALTASFFTGIRDNPDVPKRASSRRRRSSSREGCPSSPMPTSTTPWRRSTSRRRRSPPCGTATPTARIAGLQAALGVLAAMALVGMFATGHVPRRRVTAGDTPAVPA